MRSLHILKIMMLVAVYCTLVLHLYSAEKQNATQGITLHTYIAPKAMAGIPRLPRPIGANRVAVTLQDRIFYSDEHSIFELKPGNRHVHLTGQLKSDVQDGPPSKAVFFGIFNMAALPDGRLLVTDNCDVRLIDTNGTVRTIHRCLEDPNPPKNLTRYALKDDELFAKDLYAEAKRREKLKLNPMIKGLAVDKNGTIYCTAPLSGDGAIYTLDLSGKLELYAKIPQVDHNQAIFPGIAVDKNLNVYVAMLDRVCKISKNGSPVPYSAPVKNPLSGKFPRAINQMQFDSEGNLWVVGEEDDRIIAVVAPDGSVLTPNKGVKEDSQKIEGTGLGFDRAGNLHVASSQGLKTFSSAIWKARLARPVK